jgi:hypothetical protein
MDEQRQRSGRARRRRRKARPKARSVAEPILIAARRPNSPRLPGAKPVSRAVASAVPAHMHDTGGAAPARVLKPAPPSEPPPKRSARIIELVRSDADELESQRRRLLARLMACEGRGAISRAAEAYRQAGFTFPEEQAVQLQLLEHFDEDQARQAILILHNLLEKEPPIKRPIFEQRLRRLEEYADEAATRDAAAALRRVIRA